VESKPNSRDFTYQGTPLEVLEGVLEVVVWLGWCWVGKDVVGEKVGVVALVNLRHHASASL
jgi:hypothetical protein